MSQGTRNAMRTLLVVVMPLSGGVISVRARQSEQTLAFDACDMQVGGWSATYKEIETRCHFLRPGQRNPKEVKIRPGGRTGLMNVAYFWSARRAKRLSSLSSRGGAGHAAHKACPVNTAARVDRQRPGLSVLRLDPVDISSWRLVR
jgi:hypothetical protein